VTLHIGFTGTRYGCSGPQAEMLANVLARVIMDRTDAPGPCVAHHGCCIGADAEFHRLVRSHPSATIVGHPGPGWPNSALCAQVECDRTHKPTAHMWRNRAIVNASQVMLATPLQDEPQQYGGTWATIRMALRALKQGKMEQVYVIGRTGMILDSRGWDA
jgi:hypothetical protein